MKTIIISKAIRSSGATFSSNDELLKVLTTSKDLDFKPVIGECIYSKKFPMLNGERVKEIAGDKLFGAIYLDSDETFQRKSREDRRGIFSDGYEKTPEFKELVDSYIKKGWKIIKDIPAQNAYWDREEKKQEIKDKKNGLVLWMRYEDRKGHPEYYQGGFSDEVFNSPSLKEYVKSGCFGWIGNSSARRPEHDKLIEKGLRKRGLSAEAMYNWISSSDGRHFAESLQGLSLAKQLQKIKKYLNSMFNICLIYGSSDHQGTYESTLKIKSDYQNQGILLPENESDYDPNGYLKMLSLMFVADAKAKGIKLPESVEKMIPSLIAEIKK